MQVLQVLHVLYQWNAGMHCEGTVEFLQARVRDARTVQTKLWDLKRTAQKCINGNKRTMNMRFDPLSLHHQSLQTWLILCLNTNFPPSLSPQSMMHFESQNLSISFLNTCSNFHHLLWQRIPQVHQALGEEVSPHLFLPFSLSVFAGSRQWKYPSSIQIVSVKIMYVPFNEVFLHSKYQ